MNTGLDWLDVTATFGLSYKEASVTDNNGLFTFNALGSGPHRLDVTASGFRRYTRSLGSGVDFVQVQLEQKIR